MFKSVLLSAALLAAGSANAATIVNGSFEGGPTLGFSSPGTGAGIITGWTIGGGGIDWLGDFATAADGVNSLDMTSGTAGSVSQVISGLTAGSTYVIKFAMAAYYSGIGAYDDLTKDMTVTVGAASQVFTATSSNVPTVTWTYNTLSFVASSSSETLTFASAPYAFVGPLLDDVSIDAAVPVPAGGLLLLTGLGALALRRRKAA